MINQKKKALTYIPNLLTTLRLVSCIPLLFFRALSPWFIIVYIFAGITDMLDGFLARKLDAATPFGAKYDSIADLTFTVICLIRILPTLELELWGWIWIAVIVLIKVVNLITSYVCHRKAAFLHTKANKVTGLLLFLSPLAILIINVNYVATALCLVATFAALQEGHFIRTGQNDG